MTRGQKVQWQAKVRSRGKRGGAVPANRPRIAERPQEIQMRRSFGYWEADSVLGRRGAKARLVTLAERKSRYLVMCHVADGRADTVGDAIIGAATFCYAGTMVTPRALSARNERF